MAKIRALAAAVSLVMIPLKVHDLFTNPPGNRVNGAYLGDLRAHEQVVDFQKTRPGQSLVCALIL